MEQIKCSIIVPIYNVEKYLRQCVDSLIHQTYRNLEIILVDDGSPDACSQICDEYVAKDDRVKVIHKENSGVSSARKAGIDISSGEYIMTIDGDDWLDLNTVECCIKAILEKNTVGCVLFPYVREYREHSSEVHFFNGDQFFEDKEAKSKVYRRIFGLLGEELSGPEQADSLVSCCMKLYRADFAKRGRWYDIKEVGSSEDALFNMYALADCNSYVYLDKCFYLYRKIEGTITSTY